jgi:hypothetical protein
MTTVLTRLMQHMSPSSVFHMREDHCPLCAVGDTRFKMKRQIVHHIPATGQIVICVEATLKPQS